MKHPYQALYHSDSDRIRFERLAAKLCELGHADNEIRYFSAPGRSELGGNHTDHQHGCVLAAAVDVDTIAAVAKNDLCLVRLTSEGYPSCVQSLELSRNAPAKPGSAESLLQGMLAAFAPYEGKKCGLDIFVSSTVLPGGGLSSSAAFEVLLAAVFNEMWLGGALDVLKLAEIGQWVENVHFGKPCGRLDQTASAVGGVTFMDFADPDAPVVERIGLDLDEKGYALCIINCGAGHEDLTDEYAAIPREMQSVCRLFGKQVLAEIPEEEFFSRLREVRAVAGDRAALRAVHIYQENRRVLQMRQALQEDRFADYLALVNASGLSSWRYLQNVCPAGAKAEQPMAITLALCERLLGGHGACRVHGGGFAGTVHAYVPTELAADFKQRIESFLAPDCCQIRKVRPIGVCELALG